MINTSNYTRDDFRTFTHNIYFTLVIPAELVGQAMEALRFGRSTRSDVGMP